MTFKKIFDHLNRDISELTFSPPVTHVYNPLDYARAPYEDYFRKYGKGTREILLLGMNPGPFGMAQTGVPFGDVGYVRDWLGIEGEVGKPAKEHPKRPVEGFDCPRGEVSGQRMWGWAQDRFGTPEQFFERFFIINYCPLCFMEESGRNRTPNKLSAGEREALFAPCDKALERTVERFQPDYVLGVGAFTESRIREVIDSPGITLGRVPHPSPASPAANRGWAPLMDKALSKLGIKI